MATLENVTVHGSSHEKFEKIFVILLNKFPKEGFLNVTTPTEKTSMNDPQKSSQITAELQAR